MTKECHTRARPTAVAAGRAEAEAVSHGVAGRQAASEQTGGRGQVLPLNPHNYGSFSP